MSGSVSASPAALGAAKRTSLIKFTCDSRGAKRESQFFDVDSRIFLFFTRTSTYLFGQWHIPCLQYPFHCCAWVPSAMEACVLPGNRYVL